MSLLIETLFLRVSDAGARCVDLEDPRASLEECQRRGRVEVISAPELRTLPGVPARVSQGERIPYTSTSAGGTTAHFAESTVTMEFDPRIDGEGVVADVRVIQVVPDFTATEGGLPVQRELSVGGEVRAGGWSRLVLEGENLGEIRWLFGLARREVSALWLFVRLGAEAGDGGPALPGA